MDLSKKEKYYKLYDQIFDLKYQITKKANQPNLKFDDIVSFIGKSDELTSQFEDIIGERPQPINDRSFKLQYADE